MFYVMSKLFAFLLKPLNMLAFCGIGALLVKNPKRKRRLFLCTAAGLLFFSNPFIINGLAGWWEIARYSPYDIRYPYDFGILLGGYTQMDAGIPAGMLASWRGDRLTTTIQLYKTGKIRRILLSGGSGQIVGDAQPESPFVRKYLLDIGIPDSAVIVEARSRNTHENALYSRTIVDSLMPGGASCLVISSAWHMRRAQPCFQKAGLNCAPFGTDFISETSGGNPLKWIEPDWRAFMKWDYLIKEWIGYVVYRLKGYI